MSINPNRMARLAGLKQINESTEQVKSNLNKKSDVDYELLQKIKVIIREELQAVMQAKQLKQLDGARQNRSIKQFYGFASTSTVTGQGKPTSRQINRSAKILGPGFIK